MSKHQATQPGSWELFRIIIPALLAILLFIFSSFYLFLPKFEQILIENKKTLVRELVHAAWHIVKQIDSEVANGSTSLAAAQKMAIDHLRHVRYGADQKDYFWINDLSPTLIMHPYRPDLEGENLSGFADPNGTRLFIEFVNAVNQEGEGFIPYLWQWKDDQSRIVPKLSFVKLYEPWGWVIGTGIYLEDVEQELAALTDKMIVASTILLLVVALLTGHQIYYAILGLRRRQQAEEALRKAHANLERKVIQRTNAIQKEKETAQKYLDVAGVMLVALNKAGEITLLNRQGCNLLKIDEQAAIGLNWFDHFLPARFRAELKEVFEKLIRGDAAMVEFYENPLLTTDGVERTVSFHNTVLSNEEGEISGILFSGEDITERVIAASEIKKKNAFLHSIIESLPYPFYVIDASNYALVLANSAACRDHDWVGKCCYSLTHHRQTPCDGTEHECTLAHVRRTKMPVILEHIHYDRDNQARYVEVSGYPIFDEQGNVTQMIEYSKDITEQKEAEEEKERLKIQLFQAQKLEALGTMAGGITHHFNNILGVIIGYLDLAKDEVASDSMAYNYLEKIIKAASRAARLVKHITTFSQQEIASGVCQPSAVLRNFLHDQRGKMPAQIQIVENHEPELGLVALDQYQFERIISNLFSNACDAMAKRGGVLTAGLKTLTLKSSEIPANTTISPGPYIQLTMQDTGHGITAENLERIFDPFFTTKAVGSGDGIGLSIVQGIVMKSGGLIEAESEVGKGSLFTVILPVAAKVPKGQDPRPR